jgi:DNA-binding response OmpR family regulator
MTEKTLLLVDDEPDTVTTYTDILESEGYRVVPARSAEEALVCLKTQKPNLMLLDIMLPGKNGIDLARELSDRADTKDIPIVMLTAMPDFPVGEGLDFIPAIRGFIYKPCSPRTLIEGIEDVLRDRH